MKFPVKLVRSIVVCAFLAGISASALSEGKEYVILKNPIANADNSLIEIFSYRCTHCYDHHILRKNKDGKMVKILKLFIVSV